MTRQENEENENSQWLEEFLELYRQLSVWERFQVDLYIQWSALQRHSRKIVWDWLMTQWKIDRLIEKSLK